MIRAFIEGCKYKNMYWKDAFIEVLKAEDKEEYWHLVIMWKDEKTEKPLLDRALTIDLYKDKMTEWHSWQR
jgi:hypothetical protein